MRQFLDRTASAFRGRLDLDADGSHLHRRRLELHRLHRHHQLLDPSRQPEDNLGHGGRGDRPV